MCCITILPLNKILYSFGRIIITVINNYGLKSIRTC